MKRGDLIVIALQGDYGKARPALVIQSDFFAAHPSVTILPVTSELRGTPLFRVDISPTPDNGLRKPSQVVVDKAQTVARGKIDHLIARIDDETPLAVERALAVFLGFG